MKNKDIIPLLGGIQRIQHLGDLDFALLLKRNEKYLEKELKLLQEVMPESPKDAEKYEKASQELADKINADNSILNKTEEFEKQVKQLAEKFEGLPKHLEKVEEINEAEYKGRVHLIDYKKLPQDATKPLIDGIELLVKFPEEWEEEGDENVSESKEA